jgi:hypothetical protein
MNERYYLYWVNPDGSRTFHLDEEFGTNWLFNSYDEAYGVGQRLTPPTIDSRLYFGVVKS